MSRELTQKENRRKNTKNFKDIEFSKIDLEYIDINVIEFFKSRELQISDEVNGTPRLVNFMLSTPERWKIVREGKDNKTATSTDKHMTPVVAFKREDIQKSSSINSGRFYTVSLKKRWSKKSQYYAKNIDAYINRKYKHQHQLVITKLPIIVTINYTANIYTTKMFQLNQLIQFFLDFNSIETLKTDKNHLIQFHFDEDFSDSTNMDDFTDSQQKYEVPFSFHVITQLLPELDKDKLPNLQNILTPAIITTKETIIEF